MVPSPLSSSLPVRFQALEPYLWTGAKSRSSVAVLGGINIITFCVNPPLLRGRGGFLFLFTPFFNPKRAACGSVGPSWRKVSRRRRGRVFLASSPAPSRRRRGEWIETRSHGRS